MTHHLSAGILIIVSLIAFPYRTQAADSPSTSTSIVYHLDRPGQVSAAVFDMAGHQVRTLSTGQKLPPGRHSLQWDGLDREGKPSPPGTYEWRVLRTPGFTRQFLVNVGTNPSWSAFDLWPGNHIGPTMVMFDQEGSLYVGSISSEGPPHLLKLSLDGRRKYWDTGTWGLNDGIIQVARIDDAIYLLDMEARLWIRRADTGGHFWGHPQRRKFPEQRIPFADLLHTGDVRPSAWPKGPQVVFPMCMAAGKEFLVLTYEKHNEVRFVWPGIDKIIRTQTIQVTRPKGVAVAPDGRVFVISGQAVLQIDVKNGQIKELVHDAQQRYPTRLAYDEAHDDLLVVQHGPDVNHVRRYSAGDGSLVAVYGRPAGRTYGRFNPLDWDSILDIAADGHGGFVTVEEFPRRVAHFRGREKHELVQQWFGGMQWGALCALDPADPTIVYLFPDHKHCARGKIDYPARSWTLTHLYDLPENFSWNLGKESHRAMFPPLGGESFWSVRHLGESTFLVNNGRGKGAEGVSIVRVDEKEQRIVPVARLGVLHPSVDKLNPPAWWVAALRRVGYDPVRSGYDHFSYAWSDTNHNGKIDPQEIVLARHFEGYTETPFSIDESWNVYRIARAPSVNPSSQIGARGIDNRWPSSIMVPNKSKNRLNPVWNWDDLLHSRATLSHGEFGGITPRPVGVYCDSKGNTYEVCNGVNEESAPDIPPSTWPNNSTGASRFVKWNAAGAREWTVGIHSDAQKPPPGEFSDIRGILGVARDCLVVLDACAPATVWTNDGLYAGSFLDARAQDGLPDFAYQRIMGNDNLWGQVVETSTGEVIWGAMGDQSTLFYRIEGWDNWERHSGKITLYKAPAASGKGTGLTAEYFGNPDLIGQPVLTRLDEDIWFGPMWGDHRELKAKNGWFKSQEHHTFDPGSCSARWTGFLEPPLTEDYLFVVYAYGQKPNVKEPLGSKVRLWIDDKLVIDEWDLVKFETVKGWWRTRDCHGIKISLHAGKRVRLKLEYASTGGPEANLHLYWQSPALDLRHVPQRFLYPSDAGK
jgi:hypothetical protein